MVVRAAEAVRKALATDECMYGWCLKSVRDWYEIGPYWPDAALAWKNCKHPRPGDRHPPRGAAVFWTGGSHDHGHIALSLGQGMIRSPDSGGPNRVATVELDWPETHWGLRYAGWTWNFNGVRIPHKPPVKKAAS